MQFVDTCNIGILPPPLPPTWGVRFLKQGDGSTKPQEERSAPPSPSPSPLIRTQKYYLSLHNPPRAPKNRGRYPEISAEKLPGAVGFRQKSPNFLSLSPASLGLNPGITRIHQMYLKIRVGGGISGPSAEKLLRFCVVSEKGPQMCPSLPSCLHKAEIHQIH